MSLSAGLFFGATRGLGDARFGVSHGAGGAFYDVTPFHRCRDGRAMSGDGEDRFTPIRSRGGKTGGNYLQRVLRAANRFGLRERGGLSFKLVMMR